MGCVMIEGEGFDMTIKLAELELSHVFEYSKKVMKTPLSIYIIICETERNSN